MVQITAPSELDIRLQQFTGALSRWRRTTNLIAVTSSSDLWQRHIQDSMQILGLAPTAKRWLDIGSGAGFPGLVIAAQLKGIADAEVHCVESDKRKCAFLAHVIRETGIPAVVHSTRVEDLASRAIMPIDAVTSRAVASLPKLLQLSREYIDRGATGIFPRGRTYKETIKILEASGAYSINVIESSTASDSGLICIQSRLVQKP